MADRKELPDIMGGLLNGSAGRKAPSEPAEQPASETAGQEAGRQIEQLARKPARQPRGKPARQQPPSPTADTDKLKTTFYLSQDIVDALEDGWLQLRRLARERGSVSKSGIVEQSLLIALEELASKGAESKLARRMAKQ